MMVFQPSIAEDVSMSTITVGVDLAKNVFSVCEVDGAGRVLRRCDLKREALALWLAQLPAGTVVAMEACSGAHHWARRCIAQGLQPRILAAQFVAPFRKSRTIKNDRNDAEAIATAGRDHRQGHARTTVDPRAGQTNAVRYPQAIDDTDERMRSAVAVFTQVRIGDIDATRPTTELPSDLR